MKRIILSLIPLLFVINLFSQKQTNSKYSGEHFLTKSRNQKKVAIILLAGGAASIITGALIPKGNPGFVFNENDGIKMTFVGIGTLSILASIPFYLASSKNKRRSNTVSISFYKQKIIFNNLVLKMQPGVILKIEL